MATSYTSLLRLAQPTTGELDGTWGDVVNDNITAMVEEALAGRVTIDVWTADAHTLTTANGTTDEARNMFLNLTDTTTDLTGAGELIVPASTKMYVVANGTGQEITVKTSGGTGVAVPDGETNIVYCDGTNVEPVIQLPASTIMARLASGDTKAVTPAELRTLINVEDNADVTDATNVDAAGAVMNTDTSTAAMSFVVDEDNMASDSATKVPTQQSTKAYVDGILIDEDNFASDSATKVPTQQSTKAFVENAIAIGTLLLDEDNFASDSDTAGATQQSIKAYVDAVGGLEFGTATSLNTGSTKNFSIDSGTNFVMFAFDELTVDAGTTQPHLRLGDSGGILITGYKTQYLEWDDTGSVVGGAAVANRIWSGPGVTYSSYNYASGLVLLSHLVSNRWVAIGISQVHGADEIAISAGWVDLTNELTNLQFLLGGTSNFQSGIARIAQV